MASAVDVERPGAMPLNNARDWQGSRKLGDVPAYIRRGFISKVYTILSVQLLLNLMIGGVMYGSMSIRDAHKYAGVAMACSLFSLVLLLSVTCCCAQLMRKFPHNFLFLFGFTVGESVAVGFACLMYSLPSVLLALASTCAVVVCLTVYAVYTKHDFTGWNPYLQAVLWTMICFSLTMFIWSFFAPIPEAVQMVYSFLGVILFSLYIVYDTQCIVGGRQRQLEIDDYCLAALMLYLDILNLFLHLLRLLGRRRD